MHSIIYVYVCTVIYYMYVYYSIMYSECKYFWAIQIFILGPVGNVVARQYRKSNQALSSISSR